MNKILNLFDEQYVKKFFEDNLLPLYPNFTEIKEIKIRAYKKLIWESTYHTVIEFNTNLLSKDGSVDCLPIICTAHSSEPRKNVYDSLHYLWEKGFAEGDLSIPHPLFYSDYFNGTFYRGAAGNNLYHYIREKDFREIENILPKTAQWFAKLHNLSTKNAPNFNPANSRIETVFPGIEHILWRIETSHPKHHDAYKKIYSRLIEKENKFLNSTDKLWLAHGDAHPENIIRMSHNKIAVIDFTDLSLADHARDLGSFSQQLEYMCARKINDHEYYLKLKKIFFDSYFADFNGEYGADLDERIENYYNWTAMRTATHFLLKHNHEPERAEPLIEKVINNLQVN